MSLSYHRLPAAALAALAAGGGGREVIRQLADTQYSKHLVLLRGVVSAAQEARHAQAAQAARAYDVLAAAQRRNPATAKTVIGHPAVGAWALHTVRACRGATPKPGAEPRGLCAVAAAAAIRTGLPADIEVPATDGVVVLPSLGTVQIRSGPAVLHTTGGTAEITSAGRRIQVPADPHQDGRDWLALRRITIGAASVLVDDADPFRMPAVPDLAPRLDGSEIGAWEAAFQAAWALLTRHHPDAAEEAAAAIRVIVPIARPPHGQRSSSSAETFGAIALSQPRDVSLLAETMIHEVQHLKLCALADLIVLTRRDDGRRFYAPWRDDPRPASGLLQGAYAYLGVTRFWRRQRHLTRGEAGMRAHAEFARWRSAAAAVTATLVGSGQLTPAGAEFARGMTRELGAWQDEPVPEESLALARREAEEHRARWTSIHGPIPTPVSRG
jgi:uncharacterized protein